MDLSNNYETCLKVVPKVEGKGIFCHLHSIRLRILFPFRAFTYGRKGEK